MMAQRRHIAHGPKSFLFIKPWASRRSVRLSKAVSFHRHITAKYRYISIQTAFALFLLGLADNEEKDAIPPAVLNRFDLTFRLVFPQPQKINHLHPEITRFFQSGFNRRVRDLSMRKETVLKSLKAGSYPGQESDLAASVFHRWNGAASNVSVPGRGERGGASLVGVSTLSEAACERPSSASRLSLPHEHSDHRTTSHPMDRTSNTLLQANAAPHHSFTCDSRPNIRQQTDRRTVVDILVESNGAATAAAEAFRPGTKQFSSQVKGDSRVADRSPNPISMVRFFHQDVHRMFPLSPAACHRSAPAERLTDKDAASPVIPGSALSGEFMRRIMPRISPPGISGRQWNPVGRRPGIVNHRRVQLNGTGQEVVHLSDLRPNGDAISAPETASSMEGAPVTRIPRETHPMGCTSGIHPSPFAADHAKRSAQPSTGGEYGAHPHVDLHYAEPVRPSATTGQPMHRSVQSTPSGPAEPLIVRPDSTTEKQSFQIKTRQTEVHRLADQVYDRIVRRIKRERELKGR
jgi:hypothetical protein